MANELKITDGGGNNLGSIDLFETKYPQLFILKNENNEIHITYRGEEVYLGEFRNGVFMSNLYTREELEKIDQHIDRLGIIKKIVQDNYELIISSKKSNKINEEVGITQENISKTVNFILVNKVNKSTNK